MHARRALPALVALAAFVAQSAYAIELGDPMDTPLGRRYRAEIAALTISARLLPTSCRLAREATGPMFPATTNPFVTEDARLIRFVSLMGFGRDAIPEVSAAMSALYYDAQPRHEVGVWALKFKSAEAASTARRLLSARDVLVKGSVVATIWRDDDTGQACQSAIESHLVKKGFSRWSTKR